MLHSFCKNVYLNYNIYSFNKRFCTLSKIFS
uniref:Uncharacterized protein n=1 Tax=Anguilla anguilla TaxID=7936 RepID=A0A0E9TW44_ANGAN